MYKSSDHRSHKGLNNRAENSHLYIRRKEKSIIKFKTPQGTQRLLSLMGAVRNLFSVYVGRYKIQIKKNYVPLLLFGLLSIYLIHIVNSSFLFPFPPFLLT